MIELAFPFMTMAVCAPAVAALVSRHAKDGGRAAVIVGLAISWVIAMSALSRTSDGAVVREAWTLFGVHALVVDALAATSIVVAVSVALAFVISAPRVDALAGELRTIGVCVSAALLVYTSDHIALFVFGFGAAVYPVFRARTLATTTQATGIVCLAAGAFLLVFFGAQAGASQPWSMRALADVYGEAPDAVSGIALAFVLASVVARKGLFPLQGWLVAAIDRGPLQSVVLGVNFHLGAFVMLRVVLPLFEPLLHVALPFITNVALLTAALGAFVGVCAAGARRQLAWVIVSQSAFVLVGLTSRTEAGLLGGLVCWIVMALAMTGLVIAVRAIIARTGPLVDNVTPLGLAVHAPRLAVFFLVCALAVVGMPGTLGFCGEDLLIAGVLEEHPYIGLALPFSTALNAITLLRLYARFFLGAHKSAAPLAGDVLPRERLVLVAIVVVLVTTGLVPELVTSARAHTVRHLHEVVVGAGE